MDTDIKEINVQEPWFQYIKDKKKKIEGRLNKGTMVVDKSNDFSPFF